MSDNMSRAMQIMAEQEREIAELRGLVQTCIERAMDAAHQRNHAEDLLLRANAERDRLRAAVEALVPIVQRDRELIGECDEYRAERDAALRLADEAMGNEQERAA